MSKLSCTCGNVIADHTANLPYKADLLPDTLFFKAFDQITELIDSLIKYTKEGKREEWIKQNFNEGYPQDLTDTQMIGDIFSFRIMDFKKQIYQCVNCGRILIQIGNTNRFTSFVPEDESECWDILKLIKQDI